MKKTLNFIYAIIETVFKIIGSIAIIMFFEIRLCSGWFFLFGIIFIFWVLYPFYRDYVFDLNYIRGSKDEK
jgi:hypothetical protein